MDNSGEWEQVRTIVGFHENPNGGIELEYADTYRKRRNGRHQEPLDQGPRPPNNYNNQSLQKYYAEEERLKTFQDDWKPEYHVTKEALAKNGFIYKGPGDKVLCVFCQKTLYSWDAGDIVEREHSQHYPNCPFVKGEVQDKNIPKDQRGDMVQTMRLNFHLEQNPIEEGSIRREPARNGFERGMTNGATHMQESLQNGATGGVAEAQQEEISRAVAIDMMGPAVAAVKETSDFEDEVIRLALHSLRLEEGPDKKITSMDIMNKLPDDMDM